MAKSDDKYDDVEPLDIHPVCAKANHQILAYKITKRFLDFIGGLIGLIVSLPFMFIISILIKATSKGPILFKQKRIGYKGKEFYIYKFRTMTDGADNLKRFLSPEQLHYYHINRKIDNDPRITSVGKFLRKASLDELPQFFNIIKNDMSLVGPRPMLLSEVEMYGDYFSIYKRVKPGITGLWQVRYRDRTVMRDRARIDSIYINRMNLLLDFKILLLTVAVVLSGKGAC